MKLQTRLALAVVGAALCAAPGLASAGAPATAPLPTSVPPSYDGQSNPATGIRPPDVPPSYDGQTNPGTGSAPSDVPPSYDGQSNPGTDNRSSDAPAGDGSSGADGGAPASAAPASSRALGRKECGDVKSAFATNRSAFGKCIAAVARALRGQTPASACKSVRLGRSAHDTAARTQFRACIEAAAAALAARGQS